MLGDMFLWLVANLKQGVIYFIKQALPQNISAGSVIMLRMSINIIIDYIIIGGRGLPSEACTSILTREILIKGL